uniref:Uncharacterized protein n=1 Tax=Romanomermis culicivorax TaxID=13658 RepID=A0A915KGM5_ROMCU
MLLFAYFVLPLLISYSKLPCYDSSATALTSKTAGMSNTDNYDHLDEVDIGDANMTHKPKSLTILLYVVMLLIILIIIGVGIYMIRFRPVKLVEKTTTSGNTLLGGASIEKNDKSEIRKAQVVQHLKVLRKEKKTTEEIIEIQTKKFKENISKWICQGVCVVF